jgi:acetyl-CoA carboxylase biotin carboxyl carrier protein
MDLDFVQSLIKALDESGLDSIEIERGGTRIRLAKTASADAGAALAGHGGLAPLSTPTGASAVPALAQEGPLPSSETASGGAGLIEITSPMVGTFYRAPAPDAPAYIELGATVSPGDTLCIIEAMKLMNELECEVSGVIREICVESAEPVEYGQVLFRVSP